MVDIVIFSWVFAFVICIWIVIKKAIITDPKDQIKGE